MRWQRNWPRSWRATTPYRRVTVDSNARCGRCTLRYLCGGTCRAWAADGNPDAALGDCTALFAAAHTRLVAALDALKISAAHWLAADLVLPIAPPSADWPEGGGGGGGGVTELRAGMQHRLTKVRRRWHCFDRPTFSNCKSSVTWPA